MTSKLCRLSCLIAVVVLILTMGVACATAPTSAGGPDAPAGTETVGEGVITDSGKVTNRRFRLKVSFTGTSEVVTLREGQTVTFQRPDGAYSLTPRISKTEIGRIEVDVKRDTGGGVEEASPIFSVGEDYEVSHELRGIDWPFLSLRVLSVQPPIRRGPNPIG